MSRLVTSSRGETSSILGAVPRVRFPVSPYHICRSRRSAVARTFLGDLQFGKTREMGPRFSSITIVTIHSSGTSGYGMHDVLCWDFRAKKKKKSNVASCIITIVKWLHCRFDFGMGRGVIRMRLLWLHRCE